MVRLHLGVAVVFVLAACDRSNSSSDAITIDDIPLTASFSAPLSSDGTISTPLSGCSQTGCSGSLSDPDGNVTSYKIGIDPDGLDQFIAISGKQLSPTDLEDMPPSGQATYEGRYDVLFIENITAKETSKNIYQLIGVQGSHTGTIALDADFENGTLTGQDQDLSIDATLEGNTVTGSATYKSVKGDLDGHITSDNTIGAFHGNDAETVFSGGFIAYK